MNLDATFRPTEELTVSLAVDNVFDKQFATAGALGFSPFQSDSVNFPGAVDAAGFNFNPITGNTISSLVPVLHVLPG